MLTGGRANTAAATIGVALMVAVVIASMLTSCGGSDAIDMGMVPGPMQMNPPPPAAVTIAGLSQKVFTFSDAAVFGVGSGLELRFGTFTGTPGSSPVTIASTGNSDEASGTIGVDPCLLAVGMSSFPSNARIISGAQLMMVCAYDDATKILRLTETASNQVSEGELCTDACNDDGT